MSVSTAWPGATPSIRYTPTFSGWSSLPSLLSLHAGNCPVPSRTSSRGMIAVPTPQYARPCQCRMAAQLPAPLPPPSIAPASHPAASNPASTTPIATLRHIPLRRYTPRNGSTIPTASQRLTGPANASPDLDRLAVEQGNASHHLATTLQTKGLPVCHPEKGEGWQTGEGITRLGQGYSLIALH